MIASTSYWMYSVGQEQEDPDIRQAQAGDRQAFAVVVARFWPRIYRWLHGLTGDGHTAEDLTQETFLKAWFGLKSYQAGTNFRAWLFRIASRCLFHSTRRASRRFPPQALPETLPAKDEGPVGAALDHERETVLQEAIARLPIEFRSALLLRIDEDFSFREIAAAMGLREETARWRVFKARQLLLKDLGPYLDSRDHDV